MSDTVQIICGNLPEQARGMVGKVDLGSAGNRVRELACCLNAQGYKKPAEMLAYAYESIREAHSLQSAPPARPEPLRATAAPSEARPLNDA